MTVKRNTIAQSAAYENRIERDSKSKDFGKKLHFPLHADGSVSSEGYRKASDALSVHRMMVQKADELAHTEGHNAHDEGLDILSNPYSGALGRAWARGWSKADSDGVVELDGQQESDITDGDDDSLAGGQATLASAIGYFEEHPESIGPISSEVASAISGLVAELEDISDVEA